jgi:phosphotransferase system enzyme I (PtsI)
MTEFTGIIASPGIRIGRAYIYKTTDIIIPKYSIDESDVESEIARVRESLKRTKEDITAIQEQISHSLSRDMADIFTSHLMVLDDPLIIQKTQDKIASEKRNAEWVINDITLELIQSLNTIKDDYLRERIIDISDINKRLINNLQKRHTLSPSDLREEVILFSKDLTPSDTAMLNKNYILAFVTDKGGRTSHTAIMARALEIPAIVGAIDATSKVRDGDIVIVDALHGKVIVNPTEQQIEEYTRYREDLKKLDSELAELTHLPSKTLDDHEIFILGNIEIPEEMGIIRDHGAQGVGLFRSEFLFLDKALPDEDRQFNEYKSVVDFFNPLPITIRTLDVGGDKIYAYTNSYKERNPFLGCRAIRFSLENEQLFRTQIRAILRASNYGKVRMMFPMITTVEELIKSRSIVYECMNELRKKKIPFDENIEIGIMIEVPSAIINADILARYADFFSIGTNDLVQYTLAVDRISEKIAYLYNPLNLAVLRMLRMVVETAERNNTPISICGEMAGEPKYAMLLIGLGFRVFSMGPAYMNQVKRIIRSVSAEECRRLVDELLASEKTDEIESKMHAIITEKFPWVTL